MVPEVLAVLSIQIGGSALALTTGIRRFPFVIAVGFITGLCMHIVIAFLQSIVFMEVQPWITIVLTAAVPATWWYLRFRNGAASLPPVGVAVVALVGLALAAVALHAWDRINFHVDSLEHLSISTMLASDTFREGVSTYQLEKRMLGLPLQHTAANLSGDYYLASLSPLLALAVLGLLGWLSLTVLERQLATRRIALFITMAGVLLLLTTNRFIHNAFYINGHLLVAALILLLAGTSWLVASQALDRPVNLLSIQLVAIPALVFTRPEGGLLAAIAIAPAVLAAHRPVAHRMALLTTLGGSVVVWQLFLMLLLQDRGIEAPTSSLGMLAFGAALLAAAPLLQWGPLERRPVLVLASIEALLWAGLLMAVVRDTDLIDRSLRATFTNAIEGTGGWGYSLVFIGVLVLIALVAVRAPHRMFLRYPLTMFIPLAFLLAYVREGAYRVAEADSLNRMLVHIVPLAILFLAATAAGRPTWLKSMPAAELGGADDPSIDDHRADRPASLREPTAR